MNNLIKTPHFTKNKIKLVDIQAIDIQVYIETLYNLEKLGSDKILGKIILPNVDI